MWMVKVYSCLEWVKLSAKLSHVNGIVSACESQAFSPTNDIYFEEAFERRLDRETAKYTTVRYLIADLAIRESRNRSSLW